MKVQVNKHSGQVLITIPRDLARAFNISRGTDIKIHAKSRDRLELEICREITQPVVSP